MSEFSSDAKKSTILVVDDAPEMRGFLVELLSDDYVVTEADSGVRALEMVEESIPDLVLLDVRMPGMDGYETCQKLRASCAGSVPVVFLSALSSLEERVQGYVAGGDDYICKPVEAPELVAKIERLLAVAASRRELGNQLDEAVGAVLSSADMAGEIGVVLDFQRELTRCVDYSDLAAHLFRALDRYGLEGCVRIQGGMGIASLNSKGDCTTLESSILDHIEAKSPNPRIQPMGLHSSFNFGSIVLFMRDLPMIRPVDMDPELSERHGRAIDNVALLLEGACTKVAALDTELARIDLNITVTNMMSMTRVALAGISASNREQSGEVLRLFENLAVDVEDRFLHLGLLPEQEESLRSLVAAYRGHVMTTLDKSRETENALGAVIAQLV